MTEVDALGTELKDFIVSVSWSHKYLISQFDLDSRNARRLKYAKVFFSVIASGSLMGIVSLFSGQEQELIRNILSGISLVASTVVATLEAVGKASNLEEHGNQCRSLANDYCDLRDDGKNLLYRLKSGEDTNTLKREFMALKEKRRLCNRAKPSVSRKAELLAAQKLKKNNDDNYQEDYKMLGLEE